ncbi:putative PIF1 DNA helicase/replication protein A1-like protein [Senna tora]|uniref:ATP-dependent DNA helicase n=1 Tax=Senna tora TaxID=362788 RepID=A0A834TA60_9FABA|nr:putative PIF1 DNA helicase/replication protein A1-like protein [Senna tora]
MLWSQGKSLKEFDKMHMPSDSKIYSHNNGLIYKELNYDKNVLAEELASLILSLIEEPKDIFDIIMGAVNVDKGGIFFVDGFGSLGKTFIWKILTSARRSQGHIVLAVASSVIASLFILGVGDGSISGPNDGEAEILIPGDLLIKDGLEAIKVIVDSIILHS